MTDRPEEQLADDRLVPVDVRQREALATFLTTRADAITAEWVNRAAHDDSLAPPYLEELPDGRCVATSLLALIEHVREGGHDMHLPAHATWLQRWHNAGLGRANIRDHFHALRDMTLEALRETDDIADDQKGPLSRLLEAAVRNLRLETSEFETRHLVGEAVEAQRQYHTLFDTSADGILIVDRQTLTVLEANAAALTLLERTREELLGTAVGVLQPELPGALQDLLQPRSENKPPTYLLPLQRTEGALRVLDVRATPVEYGGRQAAQVLLRDVTEGVRFREELERRADELQSRVAGQLDELGRMRTFLENIINALPMRLLVLDENLVVLHANLAYLSQRRLSREQVEGRHISEVFPRELLEDAGLREAMLSTLQTGDRVRWAGFRQATDDHAERILNIGLDPCAGIRGERSILVSIEDVTERHRQLYERSILHQIVQAMLGLQDLPRLLHAILTGITAGGAVGLGFNRATLLLADEEEGVLRAEMAVGPESAEEAARVWSQLSSHRTLQEFLTEYDRLPPPAERPLRRMVEQLVFPLTQTDTLPMLAAASRETIHVLDAAEDPRVSPELRAALGADEFVVAPMVVQDKIIGVAIADNSINRQQIHQTDVQLLTALANHAALAIDSARLYAQAKRRAAELDEAYRKLEAATERLVRSEALAAIGEVTAIVAHEIRNPLSTIGGFARMLKRRADEPEIVARNASIIAEEVAKLEHILSGLLDFSKPSRPKMVACSLREVVEASATAVAERLAQGNVHLVLDLAEDLPLVPLDCHQMQQVVANLIINAVDAMPDGGTVTVSTRQENRQVILAVQDTGMGIPAHHLDQIFDHFFTTKPTGTGLGLALAKKVVEDHGARLEVTSQEGAGSTFSIIFNLDQSEPPMLAQLRKREAADA